MQTHSLPVDHSESLDTTIEPQVDHSESLLPDKVSSPLVDISELPETLPVTIPLESSPLEQSDSSLKVDESKPLEDTPEPQVDESVPLGSSEPMVDMSESLVDESEPQATSASSPLVATSEPLTREYLDKNQLGDKFNKHRDTIRRWEESGKLAELGWEPVPNSNNPRLYQRVGG